MYLVNLKNNYLNILSVPFLVRAQFSSTWSVYIRERFFSSRVDSLRYPGSRNQPTGVTNVSGCTYSMSLVVTVLRKNPEKYSCYINIMSFNASIDFMENSKSVHLEKLI